MSIFQFDSFSNLDCQKSYFLYLKLMLLLSGDISLNSGSIKKMLKENWKVFKSRDVHVMHLNMNNLLPKIDEIKPWQKHRTQRQ